MTTSKALLSTLHLALFLAIAGMAFAQQAAPAQGGGARAGGRGGGQGAGVQGGGARGGAPATRVSLFFREEWKNETNEYEPKIAQAHVGSGNLELKLYGPTGKEILVAGAATSETNPIHPWTGMCTTPCGLALRDKTRMVDLTGLARIKWNTKVSGLHQVRPMVKLADGTVLVGDFADGIVADWQEREFSLQGIKWIRLDPERGVTTGTVMPNPDLSKVDEVGFFDIVPGSGHGQGGWVDVAKFEVYGRPVPRQ